MVQMTRGSLRDVRTRLQNTVDAQITENTTGAITGTIMNNILDTVSQVLVDIIDSADILASSALAPAFRSFLIDGQSNDVNAGTVLSGTVVFDFVINEPDNVDGNLTLTQGAATLSTTIDPKGGSFNQAINSVTLNAGESVTFTLSGTAIVGAGGAAFNQTFVVTAREPDDFIYWGFDTDNNPADFDTGTAQSAVYAQSQTITVPNTANDRYLVIAQRADDPDLTQINIDGINQLAAFTKTANAFTVNGKSYSAWASVNELTAAALSGQVIQLVR